MKAAIAINPEKTKTNLKKNKAPIILVGIIGGAFVVLIAIIVIGVAISSSKPSSYEKCVVLTATELYNDGDSHEELFEKAERSCDGSQKLYNTPTDFANHYNSQWDERSGEKVGGMTLEQWHKEYKK